MILQPITQREVLSIEKVIQRKLGYLKVPQAFRDKYGSPVHYPEPKQVSTAETEFGVFLIYEFPKAEMLKLQKPSNDEVR